MRNAWAAVITLLAAAPVAAQDVAGHWATQFAAEGAPPLQLVIVKAADRHLATFVAPNGDILQAAITLDGRDVTLRFTLADRGGPVTGVMTGALDGDRMTGTAAFNRLPSQAWTATRQVASDTPSRSRDEVQIYPLGSEGFLLHEPLKGVLRKIAPDSRQAARVKVPTAHFMRQRDADLVVSTDHRRAALIYRDSDMGVTQTRHRILLLQTDTLRTVGTLQLGECRDARQVFPRAANVLTMVCRHSKDPAVTSAKPTVALVWLDVQEGRVLRWFALGGTRRADWFGPLFFGYSYDTRMVWIERARNSCPVLQPPVPFQSDAPSATPPDASEFLFVLRREKSGDVWAASLDPASPPRQVAAVPFSPDDAILCSDRPAATPHPRWLFLIHKPALHTTPIDGAGLFRTEYGYYAAVLDTATGRLVAAPKELR